MWLFVNTNGGVIGQSPASIATDGARTYFWFQRRVRAVEARINSEYTAIRNRAGTTSFLTINAKRRQHHRLRCTHRR